MFKESSLTSRRQTGITLIEVLIALLVILIGLLGYAALQTRLVSAEIEAYQRSQALIILADVTERIYGNRSSAPCYAITSDATAASPYLGYGANAPKDCSGFGTLETIGLATDDLNEIHTAMTDGAESVGGTGIGYLEQGRVCIEEIAGTDPDSYRVSVAWLGAMDSVTPQNRDGSANTCGQDLYSSENRRRVVSAVVALADIEA